MKDINMARVAWFAHAFEKFDHAGLRYYHQISIRVSKFGTARLAKRNGHLCQYARSISTCKTSPLSSIETSDSRVYHSCFPGITKGINTKFFLEGKKNSFLRPRFGKQVPCDQYYTSAIVVGMQDLLLNIQSISGLPWWAAIMSTTILFRLLITLPLARHQGVTVARMELVQPMINEIIEALKHNVTIRGKRSGRPVEEIDREFRMSARVHIRDIYKREKCNPLKLYILPWAQLPLWIVISLALRNISGFFPREGNVDGASLCNPDLVTGGLGWITDLSSSDPYYILPFIIGITNYMNIELNSLRKKDPSKWQRAITRLFRMLTIAMVFVASHVPSAMSLYWATSSSYGLVQNLLLMQPSVRRMLKIPKSPSESKTPIKDKWEILKYKADLFLKVQRK